MISWRGTVVGAVLIGVLYVVATVFLAGMLYEAGWSYRSVDLLIGSMVIGVIVAGGAVAAVVAVRQGRAGLASTLLSGAAAGALCGAVLVLAVGVQQGFAPPDAYIALLSWALCGLVGALPVGVLARRRAV